MQVLCVGMSSVDGEVFGGDFAFVFDCFYGRCPAGGDKLRIGCRACITESFDSVGVCLVQRKFSEAV